MVGSAVIQDRLLVPSCPITEAKQCDEDHACSNGNQIGPSQGSQPGKCWKDFSNLLISGSTVATWELMVYFQRQTCFQEKMRQYSDNIRAEVCDFLSKDADKEYRVD